MNAAVRDQKVTISTSAGSADRKLICAAADIISLYVTRLMLHLHRKTYSKAGIRTVTTVTSKLQKLQLLKTTVYNVSTSIALKGLRVCKGNDFAKLE